MRASILFIFSIFTSPKKVLLVCSTCLVVTLLADGSLIELWKLYGERKKLEVEISSASSQIISLDGELKRAKDPYFIKRQARDRFNMVGEHDLLFLFPTEG